MSQIGAPFNIFRAKAPGCGNLYGMRGKTFLVLSGLTIILFQNCGEPMTTDNPFSEQAALFADSDCFIGDYDCLNSGSPSGDVRLLSLLMTSETNTVVPVDTRSITIGGLCDDGGFADNRIEVDFKVLGSAVEQGHPIEDVEVRCEQSQFRFTFGGRVPGQTLSALFTQLSTNGTLPIFEIHLRIIGLDDQGRFAGQNQINGIQIVRIERALN